MMHGRDNRVPQHQQLQGHCNTLEFRSRASTAFILSAPVGCASWNRWQLAGCRTKGLHVDTDQDAESHCAARRSN